jgi:hypothetical protein
VFGITVSAGASSLQISQWTFDLFDHAGVPQDHEVLDAVAFAQFFNQCGPGSSRLLAQNDACTAVCADLGGDTTGSAQVTIVATDEAGRSVTFSTPRTTLAAK